MANNNLNKDKVNQGSSSRRGFASMDEQKQREIASKGGRASAESDTSNRGFASMDGEKQRQIASEGGRASGISRRQNQMNNRIERGSQDQSRGEWRESGNNSGGL
jgi:uncharacterized protein